MELKEKQFYLKKSAFYKERAREAALMSLAFKKAANGSGSKITEISYRNWMGMQPKGMA